MNHDRKYQSLDLKAGKRLKSNDLFSARLLNNSRINGTTFFQQRRIQVHSKEVGNHHDTEVDEGVEVEGEEDPDTLEIKRPFDPEKIKVRTLNILVDHLVDRIEHKEIDLAPEFQRIGGIWNDTRKSRLIESLLLRIPIPVFYVSADEGDNWSVVDGVQRISTIFDYVKEKFALRGLEYLKGITGLQYSELPRNMHRRIKETQLIVNVIEPGTPNEVMFNIFHRINTGGVTLNGQEIRHALNPGPVRGYLQELSQTKEFLLTTRNSIKTKRMADRECVLRFLAFYIIPWKKYGTNDLDGYLVESMKKLNSMKKTERDKLKIIFQNTMKTAENIFGEDAFRKRYNLDDRRKPINKALLEAWSVGLARCSEDDRMILVRKRKIIQKKFIHLLNNDPEFDDSVSTSTGAPQRVKKRFSEIQSLIEGCL